MKHDDPLLKLSAYVDDALDDEQTAECERLLFTHPDARDRYRELRALRHELTAPPVEAPLPLALDLRLTALAEDFLAEREDTTPAPAANEAPPEVPARRALIAAAVMAVALVGMSFFAQRGGAYPTLTVVDHQVPDLSTFAHELIGEHLSAQHSDDLITPPSDAGSVVLNVEQESAASTTLYISLPKLSILGGSPGSWQPLELGGEPLVYMGYQLHSTPVSMFAMSTFVARDEFDLFPEAPEDDSYCPIPEALQCHTDGLGHSLCVQPRGEVTRVWVARLPQVSLARIVASAP